MLLRMQIRASSRIRCTWTTAAARCRAPADAEPAGPPRRQPAGPAQRLQQLPAVCLAARARGLCQGGAHPGGGRGTGRPAGRRGGAGAAGTEAAAAEGGAARVVRVRAAQRRPGHVQRGMAEGG